VVLSLRPREIAIWCLLAALLLLANLIHWGGPAYSNDSYQYLSAAENISAGRGASTSIINFDIERVSGRVPAPLTTFPPGYSFAIAQLNRSGLDVDRAAMLVSMLSFLALIPLLAWGARVLELERSVTRLVFVWLLANSWSTYFPLKILSESAFTAVSTGAIVALMAAERHRKLAPLLIGSVLVGLSYWVRYAGLFLFAAVLAYFAVNAVFRRDRRSFGALLCCAIPLAIIGLGVIRNVVLTSTWQGGNTKGVVHPVLPVVKEFVISSYHLFFGDKVLVQAGVVEVIFLLAALTFGLLAAHAVSKYSALRVWASPHPAPLLLLVSYLAVYCLGMIYVAVFSVISFGTRMFYPILPLLLLALGYALNDIVKALQTSPRRRALAGSVALLTVCYFAINARSVLVTPGPAPAQVTNARFASPGADGQSLRSWVDAHIPRDAIIVTTEAHGTSYALKRKTVALTESGFSEMVWDEPHVEALMHSYGAQFLILYPHAESWSAVVQRESPFLAGLLEGRRPGWLRLAAGNQDVKIFRRLATSDMQ
jgi:hypothetical protein